MTDCVEDPDPTRFADAFSGYACVDKENPPTKGGLLLTGSSGMRLFDCDKYFPEAHALNRAFGGSEISDLNYWIEKAIFQYEPSRILFFCGSNDIWRGKPADQVIEDYEGFLKRLFRRLPEVQLMVMEFLPQPKRMEYKTVFLDTMKRMRQIADVDDRITMVPGNWDKFLDSDGSPRTELFKEDRVHLLDPGYDIWHEILEPYIQVISTEAERSQKHSL